MAQVLVTGANKGLGLGMATTYARRGDDVIAACRVTSPELDELGVEVVEGVELREDAAVARLAEAVGARKIDVLICNAGVNHDAPDLTTIDVDSLRDMFDINALGSIRVVLALLPALGKGSKVAFITTGGLGSTMNLNAMSPGNYGYRMSKAAQASFALGLARDTRDRGIAVTLLSPGPTDTPLLQQVYGEGRTTDAVMAMMRDIHTVGQMIVGHIDELTLDVSPRWLCTPEGAPAISDELLAQLAG